MRQVESEQLALFDTGPNMAEVRSNLEDLKQCTRAKSTLIAYACDWKDFESWCASTGRQALPATGETVALYVASRVHPNANEPPKRVGSRRRHAGMLSISSVQRHVAAIAFRHKAAGLPMFDTREARAALNGARRQRKESPQQRSPVLPEQLRKMCARLYKEKTALATRDRAVLTLGFSTGLRRSNLSSLDLSDIRFVPHKGMILTIQSSKTDQEGKGQTLRVFYGCRPTTCPVRALRCWIKFRGNDPGPLFYAISAEGQVQAKRIRPYRINQIVKNGLHSIGVAEANYGAHSLRAGFVTTAHTEGASPLAIMEYTGHHTVEMVNRYLRPVEIFPARSPLGRAV